MILFNWMNFILARSFHEIGIDACRVERQTQCELLCARAHLFSFHTHYIRDFIVEWISRQCRRLMQFDIQTRWEATNSLSIGVSVFVYFFVQFWLFSSLFSVLPQRNGTLTEVSTINTGHNGMDKFGYLDQLNGMPSLPFWDTEPCTNITASEGSFFPPREFTKSDMRYVYDKDLCRIIPLEYIRTVYKDGIPADLYEMPENTFGDSATNSNNSCYDTGDYKAVKGLQNISPCQYSECSPMRNGLQTVLGEN